MAGMFRICAILFWNFYLVYYDVPYFVATKVTWLERDSFQQLGSSQTNTQPFNGAFLKYLKVLLIVPSNKFVQV